MGICWTGSRHRLGEFLYGARAPCYLLSSLASYYFLMSYYARIKILRHVHFQVNLVFLAVALAVALKSKHKKLRKMIFGIVSLTFVLGITWLFGFLYFNKGSIATAYIFTILNSLQGFVIFITFCVLNKKVRNELHKQFVSNKVC